MPPHNVIISWVFMWPSHRFPACHMRWLKGCPDGSASTARDYAGLLCNLYQDAGPKRYQHSQTSRVQSTLNRFYIWCNIFPFLLVSILLYLPSNSSILSLNHPLLFPSLRARECIKPSKSDCTCMLTWNRPVKN